MYLRAGALDEFVSRVIDSPKRVPYAYQNEFFDSAHSLSNIIKEFLASLMIDYKDFIYNNRFIFQLILLQDNSCKTLAITYNSYLSTFLQYWQEQIKLFRQ